MEKTQTASPGFDFEQFLTGLERTRAIVEEITRRQEETAEQMKDTDRRMKETDRRMKETDQMLKETDRLVKENAERLVKENAERQKEIDRLVKENAERQRVNAERQKETERLVKENAERLVKENAERQRENAERQKETDRLVKENAERLVKENAERQKEADRRHKEIDQMLKEVARRQEETARQMKETDVKIGRLGNRFGEMVQYMLMPNLVDKFRELDFVFTKAYPEATIKDEKNRILAEIDITLENGDKVMIVEVKSKPSIDDVRDHVKRMEKVRLHADLHGDKRKFLGSVAGMVVKDNVRDFALNNGFYVIEPSGDTFNIIKPEGKYHPREW
jgi:DNA repair exonuclease SbcCD ATPase subunit